MKILVAEDELGLQKIIGMYLQKEGYEVVLVNNGQEALEYLYEGLYDLVVLDWMMPHLSGIEVCREIRRRQLDIKVMLLTAKADIEDELVGLGVGANDYIKKPFDPRILIARVKRLLGEQETLVYGEMMFYVAKGYVEVEGKRIMLSKTEQGLLKYLMKNKGIILSREKLLNHVWGMAYDGDDRTVDTHIRRLRKK